MSRPPATLALTPAERRQLLRVTRELLAGYYCHLPQKRSLYGFDAVVRLSRMLDDSESLRGSGPSADRAFLARYLEVLQGLRDLHTGLSFTDSARRGWVAAMPVFIERCGPPDAPRYLVTKTAREVSGLPRQKAVVTHWNGVPVDVAVNRLAARTKGANPGAALARAVEHLTVRPLDEYLHPDEDWVLLSVEGRRAPYRLDWQYVHAAQRLPDADAGSGLVLGLDRNGLAGQAAKQLMFARSAAPTGNILAADRRRVDGKRVGYLRIYSFQPPDAAAALADIRDRVVDLSSDCDLLVVDVRNNPGGSIPLAAAVLGLFTDRAATARFSLVGTPEAAVLARTSPQLQRWRASLDSALRTGDGFSAALPVTLDEPPGRVTERPAVLITDGTTYSAGDVFAAGWVDGGAGPVIGTSPSTGAGGANVWTLTELRSQLPETEAGALELPAGLELRFSLRRALRSGTGEGLPIEDAGVPVEDVVQLTPRDLLGGNDALVAAAVRRLTAGPPPP